MKQSYNVLPTVLTSITNVLNRQRHLSSWGDAAASEEVLAGRSAREREGNRSRFIRARRVPRNHVVHGDKPRGKQEDPGNEKYSAR